MSHVNKIRGDSGNNRLIGRDGDDKLFGKAGEDILLGKRGNDVLRGGSGDDRLVGGGGGDTVFFNVSQDGADAIQLGAGSDVVNVSAAAAGQIRVSFTSSEVGDGNVKDSNSLANQDGGLAVRLQAEDGSDSLTGAVSRFDDEGITFMSATAGVTFDVRDLVSGAARGDTFDVVQLGTLEGEVVDVSGEERSYYINAGMGDDTVIGGVDNDFLVGGAGNDELTGNGGDDKFIAGGGFDILRGGAGEDTFIFAAPLDPTTNIDRIRDFSADNDLFQLDDAVFTGLTTGALDEEAFTSISQAREANDRIIYDQNSGKLYFDADGGRRDDLVQFARLSNREPLTADDFFVI